MPVVGRGDQHRVDIRPRQHLAIIARGEKLLAPALFGAREPPFVDVGDRHQFDARHLLATTRRRRCPCRPRRSAPRGCGRWRKPSSLARLERLKRKRPARDRGCLQKMTSSWHACFRRWRRGGFLFQIHCTRYQVQRHAQFLQLGFELRRQFVRGRPESSGNNVLARVYMASAWDRKMECLVAATLRQGEARSRSALRMRTRVAVRSGAQLREFGKVHKRTHGDIIRRARQAKCCKARKSTFRPTPARPFCRPRCNPPPG
jgi:hypothetical protein